MSSSNNNNRLEEANLITRKKRRDFDDNRNESNPTGEAESLYGRITVQQMGDRAQVDKFQRSQQPESLIDGDLQAEPQREVKHNSTMNAKTKRKVQSVLDVDDLQQIKYQPRNEESTEAFQLLMNFVVSITEDQQYIQFQVDDLLAVMMPATDVDQSHKKVKAEEAIGDVLSAEQFSQIGKLCSKITDYHLVVGSNESQEDDVEQEMAVQFGNESDHQEDLSEVEEDEESHSAVSLIENLQDDDVEEVLISGASRQDSSLVDPLQVSEAWFTELLSSYITDAVLLHKLSNQIINVLRDAEGARDCENMLAELLNFEHEQLVQILVTNQLVIYWGLRLSKAKDRNSVASLMVQTGHSELLAKFDLSNPDAMQVEQQSMAQQIADRAPTKLIDIDSMIFKQGSHTMTNKKCLLPEGSYKKTRATYEEIVIPAPQPTAYSKGERLFPIQDLPEWMHAAFKGAKSLNRVQSRLYPMAYGTDENLLLCAPTGAGKTNVALLTILNEIGKHRNDQTGQLRLDNFKIVYIAPMKALVQEMVGNFSARLQEYGIQVSELTGDRQMTRQQIADTQIIVTTPEKWDIVTRKGSDRAFTLLVRLVIIDEIHLLHDDRGPVLESIVARTVRQIEQTRDAVRLVGLSATLPNYHDVAAFMRVDPEKGLFHFDNSYRPCPLQQTYVGVTERKPLKRNQIMNEITYEKVIEQAGKNQVIVFVHSRKDTVKTAKSLRDLAIQSETVGLFLQRDSQSKQILQQEANKTSNKDLQDLLPYGFGIHHAGMNRVDRTLVEELFADKHIQVLVSTATLAWGVNLPAHSVIIKGTQVYSPEKGKWIELSPQDVLQMLGRAGRPQYDTFGEGTIITTQAELQFYLSLLNTQLPIESQFMAKLADMMNAEIVLGTIRSREEAIDWLGYTYLFIRMLRSPLVYGISDEERVEDPYLDQKRVDLVHTAATVLQQSHLIKYDVASGSIIQTELGRIASYYYIAHTSMSTYNKNLRPSMGQIDLFRVFSMSDEFKFIPVRFEEKFELQQLIERVPIPIKETADEPLAKINVLLQAYISQLKLDGFALVADMVYITQSAGRLMRALFEICLRREWSSLARKTLDLCKMVDRRMWQSMTPIRQINGVNIDLLKRLERKEFTWSRMYDLDPLELGELVRNPKAGKLLHKLVHHIPKLDVQCQLQPITRSLIKVDLTITPDFMYDTSIHNRGGELFWILVEDCDGEKLLYCDQYLLNPDRAEEEFELSFTVPLYDPVPPCYFVSLLSDRWLHADSRMPLSFQHMILPNKSLPLIELDETDLLPVSALKFAQFEKMYLDRGLRLFNSIQTQTFPALYGTDESIFIGSPSGSGSDVCVELAILRHWAAETEGSIVFIASNTQSQRQRFQNWSSAFSSWGRVVACLNGETAVDFKHFNTADLTIATPTSFDLLSRQWTNKKSVQSIGLFIVEDLHLLGGSDGHIVEAVVSRMRFMASQIEKPMRIVALSESLSSAVDVGDWIGCDESMIYNFHPDSRPVPIEIHMQSYSIPHFASAMIAMTKPALTAFVERCCSEDGTIKQCIVIVPDASQARKVTTQLAKMLLHMNIVLHNQNEINPIDNLCEEVRLNLLATRGIGYLHDEVIVGDKNAILELYAQGKVKLLVATRSMIYDLYQPSTGKNMTCHCMIMMNSQFLDENDSRLVDYSIAEVLRMIGLANCGDLVGDDQDNEEYAKVLLMLPQHKKNFYKKFIHEGLPIESHWNYFMHEDMSAQIANGIIKNKQDAVDYLTWSFMYRRLAQNPSYYGLESRSDKAVAEFMSELVEAVVSDLAENNLIELDEDEFTVRPVTQID